MPVTDMDFNAKQLLASKDDPFWLELFGTVDLLKYRFVKAIIVATATLNIIKTCVLLYNFANKNISGFVQFAPTIFGELYGIVSCIAVLLKTESFENTWSQFDRWSFDSAGEKTEQKIRQIIRNRRRIFHILYVLSLSFLGLAMMTTSEFEMSVMYPLFYIRQNWPDDVWWLGIVYKIFLSPLYYTAIVHPLIVVIGAEHAAIQHRMLIELIVNITWDFEDDKGDEMHEPNVQNVIRKRLKFLVERNVQFFQFASDINANLVKQLFPFYVGFAYLVGVGVIMSLMGMRTQMYNFTVRDGLATGVLVSCLLLFSGLVIFSGQGVEDMVAKMKNKWVQCNWYKWNGVNQKTLLFILSNYDRNVRLQFSDGLALNYELGVRMLRGVYSLTALMYYFYFNSN